MPPTRGYIQPPRQPVVVMTEPPPEPPRRPRTRWELLAVPLAVIVMMWAISMADPACSFDELMARGHVRDTEAYRELGTLGCVAVLVVWIARILRRP